MSQVREIRIIEKGCFGTIYAFRGPRSHRLVSVHVPGAGYQRDKEQLALQKANEKFGWQWLRQKYPQDWAQRIVDQHEFGR